MNPNDQLGSLKLRIAQAQDAATVLHIIHSAFAARPPVYPPPEALAETEQSIRQRLDAQIGIVGLVDEEPVAALFLSFEDAHTAMVHRVSVLPGYRHLRIAAEIVRAAAQLAADQGRRRLQIVAREELTKVVDWWRAFGFVEVEPVPHGFLMARDLPVRIWVPTAAAMQQLGVRLAGLLNAGDLLVANGELGAGKTTLAQGLGQGLSVQGPVISPTFVLSRRHLAAGDGPSLLHVDAYRLGSAAELEDLDLETSMAGAVTLVEWGAGLAEGLNRNRLEIEILRSPDPDDDARVVYIYGVGPRWQDVDLSGLEECSDE